MYKKVTLYREDESMVIGYWESGNGPSIVKTCVYYTPQFGRIAVNDSSTIGQTLDRVIRDREACGFKKSTGWQWDSGNC